MKTLRPIEPATDLDVLVKKGFPEKESREALARAGGDLRQAILILMDSKRDTSWMKETTDQWVNNVPSTKGLPKDAESRALWKSPVYVRVGNWTRLNSEVYYVLTVIMLDRRQYTLNRNYSEFCSFWISLPYGACTNFQNHFPQPGIFQFLSLSEEQIESRRIKLEEWMRELCLNESCMSNPKITKLLYEFLEVNEHAQSSTNEGMVISPSGGNLSRSPFLPAEELPQLNIFSFKKLSHFPIPINMLSKYLPCHVKVSDIPDLDSLLPPGSAKDTSDDQLSRDLSRDRVVVNGKRILGSQSGILTIINSCIEHSQSAISDARLPTIQRDTLDLFSRVALKLASRTESAFTCHTALTVLFDALHHPEILIIPESSLAKPLILNFTIIPISQTQIKSRNNDNISNSNSNLALPPKKPPKIKLGIATGSNNSISSSSTPSPTSSSLKQSQTPFVNTTTNNYNTTGSNSDNRKVLVCSIEAATVYRITNADSMQTIAQISVTYCAEVLLHHYLIDSVPTSKQLSLNTTPFDDVPIPPVDDNNNNNNNNYSSSQHTERILQNIEKTPIYLVLEKETTTTNRDWSADQTL